VNHFVAKYLAVSGGYIPEFCWRFWVSLWAQSISLCNLTRL